MITTVPDEAIQAPASLSQASFTSVGARARITTAAESTARSIPPAALAAYQRAESVIRASDPTCGLDWELLAALGRVESDHGRHGGSSLDEQGVARPAIIGVALDGRQTRRIDDTDAGQLDNDTRHDRAVGPMQFIPSTWASVGVDADGDGVRNPQDIDDAALAAAVYLCSGDDDLAAQSGREAAVFRYNRSEVYVSVVLSLRAKYAEGDLAATPVSTVSASPRIDTRLVGTAASKDADDRVESDDRPAKKPKRADAVEDDGVLRAGGGLAPLEVDVAFQEQGDDTGQPGDTDEPTDETGDPGEPGGDQTTAPDEPQDDASDGPGEATTPPSEGDAPDDGTRDDSDADDSEQGDSRPSDPQPSEPQPGEPAPNVPALIPTEDNLCPIIDPETGEVLDASTGEPVLDPETEEPLTIEDLVDYIDADGISCEIVDPATTSEALPEGSGPVS